MKQCPACRRELGDHLSFCPFDGFALIDPIAQSGYVGTVLDDKYRLEEKVGEGGTGKVYRATHILMDATVAVKILHPELASDQVTLERFRREARASSQIRHPNAVAVTDFGVTKDTRMAYLVMEFLEGQDLRQRISTQIRLSYDETYQILEQICSAVHAAHTKGIIHRDLKPDNVWLLKSEDGYEQVKVLDFGIAKLKSYSGGNLTEKGLIIGTPNYMSPEQCKGEQLDPRSDIYSMGVILYEMLTGDAPFQADTPVAVVLKHANEPPRPPRDLRPDMPEEIETVILRALEKDKKNRQGSALQLANEFESAVVNSGLPLRHSRSRTPRVASLQTTPMTDASRTHRYEMGSPTSPGQPTIAAEPPAPSRSRESYETQVALPRSYETQVALPGAEDKTTLIEKPVVEEATPARSTQPVQPERSTKETQVERRGAATPVERAVRPAQPKPSEERTLLFQETPAPPESGGLPRMLAIAVGVMVLIAGVAALWWFLRHQGPPATPSSVATTTTSSSTSTPTGMVSIPAGKFTMGNNGSDEESEKPEHDVAVKSFFIDRYEVTNQDYYEFVKATRRQTPEHWVDGRFPAGEDRYPVVNVSWFDAESYAKWSGKRLPTEEEWEYAARGEDKRLYPWGNEFTKENANSNETEKNHAIPVGSYPSGVSRFGLYDMAGNVAEWTASDYTLYPGSSARMEAGNKIIRGGSFRFDKTQAMVTTRFSVPPGTVKDYIGFRLAKDAP